MSKINKNIFNKNKFLPFISLLKLIILINIFHLSLNEETSQNVNCNNIPFCQRNMFYNEGQTPLFYIDDKTISISGTNKDNNNIIKLAIKNYNKEFLTSSLDLEMKIFILKRGIFRIKIKPIKDKNSKKRFELNEEDDLFETKENFKEKNIKISKGEKDLVVYYFSTKNKLKYELVINFSPFQLKYKIGNNVIYHINSKNFFSIETPDKDFVPTENDSMTSIKLDMFIPGSILLAGLPERCGSSILSDTLSKGQDGYYHFYNIDIFKYSYDQYNALYGSIPYLMTYSYGGKILSGFFWNNPSETFIYITTNNDGKQTIFLSESGIFDFSFLGSTEITHYYKILHKYIGKTPLPNIFALGYHQSRFSYEDINDIRTIDQKFDEYNIPYETIWLDIDHTDNKKYFTYNTRKFPNDKLKEFLSDLDKKGREIVVVIDPHLKTDSWYPIYYKSKSNNYFIKKDNKNDFVGKCWCEDASFLDFFNKDAINYWKSLILKNEDYFLEAKNIHIWNDMNEPSVFKISRNTIPKDAKIKYDKNTYEHREVHNLYGYFMHKASYEALNQRYNYKIRPFILTRSFFIGSHKYAAVWTGDVKSNFDGLKNTIPMLISLSLSGYSLIGADVGGFAEDGNIELFKRWYQNGVFYPFFRGHSHEMTLRRELWLFSERDFSNLKNSIIIRYTIIPYIYTQFYLHYSTGMPIIKPVWFYDQSETLLTEFCDNEYFFGDSILVRPVLTRQEDQQNLINVYLPEKERWFDFYSNEEIVTNKKFDYSITLETIGAFVKGGSIIPKKMRIKRSTKKMKNDPLTIFIYLDRQFKAKGIVYFDDEESFEYQKGNFSVLEIEYNEKNQIIFNWQKDRYDNQVNRIEKIVIIGNSDLANLKKGIIDIHSQKKGNKKIEVDLVQESVKKRIEIIQLNKFLTKEIKSIQLA